MEMTTSPTPQTLRKSMHCLYYMIRCAKLTNPPLICIFTSLIILTLLSFSEGKKCLMGGMAELFAFVKVLEDNWHAVMRGVSIKYGSTTKTQQDISMSIGWQKPPKRNPALRNKKSINDGQSPDTTAALLPKNMGRRPKYSKNVDQSPFTTYVSYSELDDKVIARTRRISY
jgi:hypothetical protein